MQEALKNPHYKKIWEEVNWKKRHPEAKSLEEALFLETYNADCNVLHCGLNLIVSMQSLCLLRNSGLHLGDKQYHSFSQSFGRPITLEDIMMILPRTFAYWNAYNSIVKVDFVNGNHHVIGYNLEWRPTKSPHEPTPETWEKISNLI